jgi:hypothetical protein
MKFLSEFIFIVITVTLLIITATAQVKYQSNIKGRVVDEQGQPVENANVRFDVPEKFYNQVCWVKNNSVFSDKDGNFVHEEYCGVSNRTGTLFIVPKIGLTDIIAPIYPPFWRKLRLSNPAFAGLYVNIEGNKEIDLGNVPLQVRYSDFTLFVLKKSGKPYYKTSNDWSRFQLIVRNEKGEDVGSSALSTFDIENKVNLKMGFVKIALPEGSWTLELLNSLDDYINETGKTTRYLSKTTVAVKKSGNISTIRLIVKRKS